MEGQADLVGLDRFIERSRTDDRKDLPRPDQIDSTACHNHRPFLACPSLSGENGPEDSTGTKRSHRQPQFANKSRSIALRQRILRLRVGNQVFDRANFILQGEIPQQAAGFFDRLPKFVEPIDFESGPDEG